MSRAQELATALKTDEALQTKMQATNTADERKKVIADAGYGDVSSADVQAAATGDTSGELSDDQLGAASGAGFSISSPFGGMNIDW